MFYQKEKQRTRAKQQKQLGMRIMLCRLLLPKAAKEPIYFQLQAGVIHLASTSGTKAGKKRTLAAMRAKKFPINQGRSVAAQVYFSIFVFVAMFSVMY